MKRVYALYRVSTKGQVDVVKDDIPMQRIACHEFAEKMKDWVIVKELEEKGVSGFKVSASQRDAIQELKEAAVKQDFDVLLVFMFDRLGRIESETPFVVEWFTSHGIECWSVNEGEQKIEQHVDKLMNYIRFWQASGESEKTSIRVKTRLQQMVSEGIYTGGAVRFGYQLVDNGRLNKKEQPMRDLVPEPVEFAAVAMMYDKVYSEGYGSHQLAAFMNEKGFKTHLGKPFNCNYVLRILKNELYRGFMVKGGVRSERIPELQAVSDEVFFGVQNIIEQRNGKKEEKRQIAMNNKGNALLSGNIFCAHCGCRLATSRYTDNYVRKDGSIRHTEGGRYICYHRSRKLNDCDGAATYQSDKIDEMVMKTMNIIFSSISGCPEKEKIESAYNKMMEDNIQMQKKLSGELKKYTNQLEKLRGEIAKALIGDSVYSSEDLSFAIQNLKEKISYNEEKLHELKTEENQKKENNSNIIPAYNQFKTWAEEFNSSSWKTKKMIANRLFSRVEVGKGYKLHLVLNTTYEQFCEEWLKPSLEVG